MNLMRYPSPALWATSPTRGEVSPHFTTIGCLMSKNSRFSMDTSPLVGEVAQRAGEGSLSNFITHFSIIQSSEILL